MNHEVLLNTSQGSRLFIIDDAYQSSLNVSDSNKDTVGLFIASHLALLADSPLGAEKPPRTYGLLLKKYKTMGVKETILSFTNLAHVLVSNMSAGDSPTIGNFIEGFKDTPVFFEYLRFTKTGDIKLLRFLYSFLSFGKKLHYEDSEFHATAFRGWQETEERLHSLDLTHCDTVADLRFITEQCLPPLQITDFRPKFGPGAVAERGVHGRLSKLRTLRYDAMIDYVFFRGFLPKTHLGRTVGLNVDRVIHDHTLWQDARTPTARISRLSFVPKNIKTARSICMEPNTLMYFQQGLLDSMLPLIRKSIYGKFIRLTDQTYNQQLSRIGSYTNSIDTIDLSSASDSVSIDLVKGIFPYSWLIPLLATRSSQVQVPNGNIITVKKFAPMGSAMCFPVQCIIFCTISFLAALRWSYDQEQSHGVRSPSHQQDEHSFASWLRQPGRVRSVLSQFWDKPSHTLLGFQSLGVYGDDICIDSRLSKYLLPILNELGFVVNKEKSFFSTSSFRESCGTYYLAGHDITPLYFCIKDVKEFITPSHIASHVELTNRAWDYEYKNLYRFLKNSLVKWKYRKSKRHKTITLPILFTSDPNQFGIRCTSPKNVHLKRRYNKSYQRDEALSFTIKYTEKYFDHDNSMVRDSYEYMRWWASHRVDVRQEDNLPVLPYDTGEPGLHWFWVPV